MAQTATETCQPAYISKPQQVPPKNVRIGQKLEADTLSQPSKQQYLMQGKAKISQAGLVVLSDEALYDQQTQQAKLDGHVELHQPGSIIKADKAELDNAQQKAKLNDTQYQLLPSLSYGESESIDVDQNTQVTELKQATLTNCRINDDGSKDWDLKFERLEINNQSQRVIGHNSTLYFKGVPIFYTPYFDYPLTDRASGLLFPEFGSYKSINSTDNSQYIKQPYYFNIAPNMDDTLTIMPISDRGVVLDNEWRFLNQQSDKRWQGEVLLGGIQDSMTGEDRWRARIDSQQVWGQGFSSSLLWDTVSDKNFYADIPLDNTLQTATLKQRLAQLNYQNGPWSSYIQVTNYLELQNSAINYEKLPEIGLNYFNNWQNVNLQFNAAATQFIISNDNHSNPEAWRLHLAPKLQHQLRKNYGYLNTTLVANMTQYQMHDNGYNPANDTTIERFVPQFAIRGGLIFERPLALFGHQLTQTLEPELQYLYTPYSDQSDIALFDSGDLSLDFNNLFALNRFSGADRIADSNQLAMALSSRLLTDSGETLAQASIGQIAYFEDRKVALSGNSLQTDQFSDIFVKIGLQNSQWLLDSTAQFDKTDYTMTNSNSRIRWQNEQHTVLMNHSIYNSDSPSGTEVLSLGAYSRINNRWDIGIYSSYDIKDNRHQASQLGLRYDSCCWAMEIIAEHTQLANGLYNDGIQVQFELKGLSSSQARFKQTLTDKLNF